MQINVVICTYNGANIITNVLKSINLSIIPENVLVDILVVDNNSSDNTKNIVFDYKKISKIPIRYVFEPNQGLSHARNRGVIESTGDIIAFTDDDVIVDQHWLEQISLIFSRDKVACIGGKILPRWESECPVWLTKEIYHYIALLDLGDDEIILHKPRIFGANFCVKKEMFTRYGLFNTNIGRIPGKTWGGEETDLIDRLIKAGELVIYTPTLIVNHCIPEKRLKKQYYRKWRFNSGEFNAIHADTENVNSLLGIPLYSLKGLMLATISFITHPSFIYNNNFNKELDLIYYIGFIWGRVRYKRTIRS